MQCLDVIVVWLGEMFGRHNCEVGCSVWMS